jgi:hypothetical protein
VDPVRRRWWPTRTAVRAAHGGCCLVELDQIEDKASIGRRLCLRCDRAGPTLSVRLPAPNGLPTVAERQIPPTGRSSSWNHTNLPPRCISRLPTGPTWRREWRVPVLPLRDLPRVPGAGWGGRVAHRHKQEAVGVELHAEPLAVCVADRVDREFTDEKLPQWEPGVSARRTWPPWRTHRRATADASGVPGNQCWRRTESSSGAGRASYLRPESDGPGHDLRAGREGLPRRGCPHLSDRADDPRERPVPDRDAGRRPARARKLIRAASVVVPAAADGAAGGA